MWLARLTPDDTELGIEVEESGPGVWKKLIRVIRVDAYRCNEY